jgi:rhodanese-related sulfurtransferase
MEVDMTRLVLTVLGLAGLAVAAEAADIAVSVSTDDVPDKKRVVSGLYLTSAEAGAALSVDPSIVFIDLRDPGETQFVGHPDPVDAIVPLRLLSQEFDVKKGAYKMAPNPNFLEEVASIVAREGKGPDDVIFVTCQSGGRTAKAADLLHDAGYSQVYALFEGIEGDLNAETGRRDLNGWKNAGLPWSYKLTPTQAWGPAE